MNKKLLLLITLAMLVNLVSAQRLLNAFSVGNPNEQFARRVVHDPRGNAILVGSFKGAGFAVNPANSTTVLNSNGDYDAFIAKYNVQGHYINAISFGGTENDQIYAVATDDTGNIYVAGFFRDTVDFDPSPATAIRISNGETGGTDNGFGGDIFVAKYNSELQFVWAFGIGSDKIYEDATSLTLDKAGNLIIGGVMHGTNIDFDPSSGSALLSTQGTTNAFVAKYTLDGQYVWAHRFGGTTQSCETRAIAVDNNNNIYITGHFDGTIDLDPGTGSATVNSAGCADVFFVKLDASGTYLNSFRIGASNCDYSNSIALDPLTNGFYISGYYLSSTLDMDPSSTFSTISNSGGGFDGFVAKYSTTGVLQFAKTMGSSGGDDVIYDVVSDPGGFTIGGYFRNTVIFGTTPAVTSLTSNGGMDGFVAQYKPDGSLISTFKIGGTSHDAVYGLAMSREANNGNEIAVTGYFQSLNVDFDPLSTKLFLSSTGQKDVFLARYRDLHLINNVKATVFIDNNLNGQYDNGDVPFKTASIEVINGGDTTSYSSNTGIVSIPLDSGSHLFTLKPYTNYYNYTPASHTKTFIGYGSNDSIYFSLQPVGPINDLVISLIPLSPVRPGFNVDYRLLYANVGTLPIINGSIQVIKDPRTTFNTASVAPSSQSGDTLTWSLAPLSPQTNGELFLQLKAAAPPQLNLGDDLKTRTYIDPIVGDMTQQNNVSIMVQDVTGSYDPNDKRESHGGTITESQVTEGEYLQYTIRFQNTGNDTAFNITIKDTLNDLLDWNSVQMVASSHSYYFRKQENNQLVWAFDNIKLVDSIKNEPLSHGYIVFKVKAVSAASVGQLIHNKASIYFDYNLPIVTNNETTAIVNNPLPLNLISFTANKAKDGNVLAWFTSNEYNTQSFEIEKSASGIEYTKSGEVKANGLSGDNKYQYLDLSPFAKVTFYRLKMLDKDGKYTYSPVRKVSNEDNFIVRVFPNPSKSTVTLSLLSEEKGHATASVVAMDGSVLLTERFLVEAGSTNKTILLHSIPSGVYFIRIDIGGVQHGIKFQKQ